MKKRKKKEQKSVPQNLVKRVQDLWNKDENSALKLGKALKAVKDCNPHGGLGEWIKKELGDSTSIRNRCSYCMRLYLGKVKPAKSKKESTPKDKAFGKMIHEVNERFKQLYDYAQAGDVDSAIMTAKTINEKANELVEMAKRNEPPTERARAATA